MSKKKPGPISAAAQAAAENYFAQIQTSVVTVATGKAEDDVQARFQEAFELHLSRLVAAARLAAYSAAYATALDNASTLVPDLPAVAPVPASASVDSEPASPAEENGN